MAGAARVVFTGDPADGRICAGFPALRVALPVLGGVGEQCLLANPEDISSQLDYTLFRAGSGMAGFAVATPGAGLETAAHRLYQQLFAVTHGFHLYRVWNFVPCINAIEANLENYRHFCRGRSLAFEECFGPGFERRLPAASAVGSAAGPLALAFIAGKTEPRHFENPWQVPAFKYPPEHGPRPPSFSRATVVQTERGRQVFLSGTAAIRGHATVAAKDLAGQLACTIENLRAIGEVTGIGAELGAGPHWQRSFKVYLRHTADLPPVMSQVMRELLRPADTVTYLKADICRADLLVEIEAAFFSET
jgi:enamine deaminase RidA (YjgF/YER057c/UK114 family)